MSDTEIKRAAHLAARSLFVTNGTGGEVADRLVIMLGSPVLAERDMGGWCFTAARDRIEDALRKGFVAKTPAPKKK